ncbi:hypothetical protein [Granulicella sp. S156]|uniref:hypothetical protein n=1 Tax=Granulicella sp. S156 TaxID=1747224 RepID=UPI00131D14EF|nr:hypothetical protein [Granulicella sp. S156]
MKGPSVVQCPSAQPSMLGAVIHGVVDAASGKIQHLSTPEPVTPELLAMTAPLLPTQVLRISAPCQGGACGHFNGTACTLVDRIVQIMPASDSSLPYCAIRATCRWFSQRGKAACMRCDQIVTDEFVRDEQMTALTVPAGRHAEQTDLC